MPKSRRKSAAARRRKRDAKGHFVKAGKAESPRRRRRARRRHHARETQAVAAPRRRKRRARRRNPWYGQPRRHAKAARKGWRRRRSHSRRRRRSIAAAPRRRRRSIRVTGRGRARSGRRSTPINIKINLSPRRRAHARRRKHRKHHAKRRRSHASARRRQARYGYTPASRQLTAESYALSNPLSGGELVLVAITGSIGYGLADFIGRYMETTPVPSGSPANTVPAGATVANDEATIGWPTWQTMAAQFGVAAVPMIASGFVDSPWGRAALQGLGLGAGAALFGGLFRNAMASLIGSTTLGQQLYLAEYEAQNAQSLSGAGATATVTAPVGMQGLPRGVGRVIGRGARTIPAGARGMGAAVVAKSAVNPNQLPGTVVVPRATTPNTPVGVPAGIPPIGRPAMGVPNINVPPGIVTNTGDVLPTAPAGTPTPGGPSTGPMCAPCTSTAGGIAGTEETAMAAIRDESCLGKIPGGMFGLFPD